MDLNTPLADLPKVQQSYLPKLKKLGLLSVKDLLWHFPFRYDDFSAVLPIANLTEGTTATIHGTVHTCETTRTWKKRIWITEAIIEDSSGTIRAVWFNQPYVGDQLDVGKTVRLSGKIAHNKTGLYFSNPAYERDARAPTNTARLVPVYPETTGITSRWLRWQIRMILEKNPPIDDMLPKKIRDELHLPDLSRALRYIHFPNTAKYALLAQKRFAFDEIFLMQITALRLKQRYRRESAIALSAQKKRLDSFVGRLPFTLTAAQKKAIDEIGADLAKNHPMNRLLNGDVGSGKTVVAAAAALQTIVHHAQAAFLAPTEVLAQQHFMSLCALFKDENVSIALLTSTYRMTREAHHTEQKTLSRKNFLAKVSSGEIDLIIGTHALLQEDVRFKNLVLVIVDEQHRFGVAQRAYLQKHIFDTDDGVQKTVPHFLTMSATPIPRTLSMVYFGNLNVSLLREMPQNRLPIITRVVGTIKRASIYDFIAKEIAAGHQTYVILPLVEKSKALSDVKAATAEHKKLQEIFPALTIGLLHGKMPAKHTSSAKTTKEQVMRDFKDGTIDILVATSVVEVGIDVPNATVMLIENAERFGLSQLHQFRGRVGRGAHQSYCFLFYGDTENGTEAHMQYASTVPNRLRIMEKHADGFDIAAADLKLRGPGQFLGTHQSGLPDLAMENITNVRLVKIAYEKAVELLAKDETLKKHPALMRATNDFMQTVHLE